MQNLIRKVLDWEWLLLLLLLPFQFLPQIFLGFVLLIIVLLLISRKLTLGYFIPPTPYNVAILVLILSLGASVWATFEFELSMSKIVGILVGIALFFSIARSNKETGLWTIAGAFIVMGMLMALGGLVGAQWQPPFSFLNQLSSLLPLAANGVPGTSEGFINANELAGVLCWVTPFIMALSIGLRRRLWQTRPLLYGFIVVSTLFTTFLLVATSSRGGLLAFGISTVLILGFFVNGRWRLVLASGALISLLILFSYGRNLVEDDIVGDNLGLSGRIEIWSRAILVLGDHPLTGVSVNGFRRVVHVLYPLFGIADGIDIAHAHNHLLQAGLDLGLPGLVSYLALWIISAILLIVTFRNLIRRRATHHPYYSLVAGLAGSLLAGWIFGLFDAIALGARPSFMWWILIGLTASVHYAVVYSGRHLHTHRRVTSEMAVIDNNPVTTRPVRS